MPIQISNRTGKFSTDKLSIMLESGHVILPSTKNKFSTSLVCIHHIYHIDNFNLYVIELETGHVRMINRTIKKVFIIEVGIHVT